MEVILFAILLISLCVFLIFLPIVAYSSMQKRDEDAWEKKISGKQAEMSDASNAYCPDTVIVDFISADFSSQQWRLEKQTDGRVFGFDEIARYELVVDEETVACSSTRSSGGVARALWGSVVAGDAGMILGASTAPTRTTTTYHKDVKSRKVRITTANPSVTTIEIDIPDDYWSIFGSMKRRFCMLKKNGERIDLNSEKVGIEIIALLDGISKYCENRKKDEPDETEQLKKYKKMFEDGLITEEEYTAKKRAILGI